MTNETRTERFELFYEDIPDGQIIVVPVSGNFDAIPISVKEIIEMNHVYGSNEPSLKKPAKGSRFDAGKVTFPVKDHRVKTDEIVIEPTDIALEE
jgi:hypothetical protein